MTDTDHVVLLDDEGRAIGTAPKSSVHGPDTALHLAFSCHVLNSEGKVLVTRRALSKRGRPIRASPAPRRAGHLGRPPPRGP